MKKRLPVCEFKCTTRGRDATENVAGLRLCHWCAGPVRAYRARVREHVQSIRTTGVGTRRDG